ncbi:MAG TPA: peroxidase-related enzyme [Pyrinomonadaceae bacterium]|nr:peroxidase-related enzyme [Pyrinomonadaceae bacterium]
MTHIALQEALPVMRALQTYRPQTAEPLNQLANVLLQGPSSLSPGERELIGTLVSSLNECTYCQNIHGAVAAHHFSGDENVVEQTKRDFETAPVSEKMKALLAIASKVQQGGRTVSDEVVSRARAAGATDLEIHDTVLIAAMFCMFNRYVDGLASWTPDNPKFYRDRGQYLARHGYSSAASGADPTPL